MIRAVDMFAGLGGTSKGVVEAGLDLVWAANHWPEAVEFHADQHPGTAHSCKDLTETDYRDVPDHEVLFASPACQGHSEASKPRRNASHEALRATAWAVPAAIEAKRPEIVIVENVPHFTRWAFFRPWLDCFGAAGYDVDHRVLTCSLMGVPQRRRRLFVVAVRRGLTWRWPEMDPAEHPIRPHLELDKGRWRSVASTSAAVRKRIAKGRANHGELFLTQHVTGHPGVSLDDPIRTVTTKDQWAIVDGDRYRPLSLRENARAMGFRDSHPLPPWTRSATMRGLGNAVPPPVAYRLARSAARTLGGAA